MGQSLKSNVCKRNFNFSPDCTVSELVPLASQQPDIVESSRSTNHLYVPKVQPKSGSSSEMELVNFQDNISERSDNNRVDDIVCISNTNSK